MADWAEIGLALATARKRLRLEQSEVAARMGLSRPTISRHETGTGGQIPLETLERYAKLYGVPTDDFLRLAGVTPADRAISHALELKDSGLPHRLQALAREFEAEALRLDADEREMAYVRQALRSPESVTLFRMGHVDRELTEAEQLKEMQSHIDMLRRWLSTRLKRRKAEGAGK